MSISIILSKFASPSKNLLKIHNINYRHLLPESVNLFITYKKFKHNEIFYDLYGWNDETLIDIYPTYKNIITIDDMPKSWIGYINTVKEATKINKMIILIYNKKYNKLINVINCSDLIETEINNIDNHNIDNEWIKATGLKNYMLDDTILDIICKNNKEKLYELIDDNDDLLVKERLSLGIDFERNIINKIIMNHYMNFVKICESYEARNIEKYKYTLSEMKKGTPIIHQAVMHDPNSKIFGCVDLLVRSDWLTKIFENCE
jgi:hypothetical protein